MPSITNDNPISTETEDYLNRSAYAKSIADLIISFDAGSSFRIGVYGGWGEGKTSVLKMIEKILVKHEQLVLWLPSWGAVTSDALLETLLFDVGELLGISTGIARLKKYTRQGTNLIRAVVAETSQLGSAANDAFGDEIERAVQKKSADSIKKDLLPPIVRALRGRKLVIIVDDLDRVRPEVIPDFLLALRELLNLPDFHFILALAPDIVHEGLAQLHQGWGRVESFLEKIVELPTFLPNAQHEDIQRLAQAQIAELDDKLNIDAINGISELLPKNPRKLKLLLRNLAGLHECLRRFSTDEIDLRALYVCQTLRFEFPRESMRLLSDSSALSMMEQARYGAFSNTENPSKATLPENEYRPEVGAERYDALCSFLRSERGLVHGIYSLAEMLAIRERPPLVTYGEVSKLLTDFSIADNDVRRNLMNHFIGTDMQRDARARLLFIRMIDARTSFLDSAVNRTVVDEIREGMNGVRSVAEFLQMMIDDFRFFENSIGKKVEWLALYNHVLKWNRWTAYDFYQEARAAELQLLRASVVNFPSSTQLEVQSDIATSEVWPDSAPTGELEVLVNEIKSTFRNTTFEEILRGFEKVDGIASLLRSRSQNAASEALVDPLNGIFSNQAEIDRIAAVASKASIDRVIHANFFDLLYLSLWGAYSPDSRLPRQELKQILSNANLTSMIWNAAMSQPVNQRNMNSLWEYRARMIADGLSESSMPKPVWFEPKTS